MSKQKNGLCKESITRRKEWANCRTNENDKSIESTSIIINIYNNNNNKTQTNYVKAKLISLISLIVSFYEIFPLSFSCLALPRNQLLFFLFFKYYYQLTRFLKANHLIQLIATCLLAQTQGSFNKIKQFFLSNFISLSSILLNHWSKRKLYYLLDTQTTQIDLGNVRLLFLCLNREKA